MQNQPDVSQTIIPVNPKSTLRKFWWVFAIVGVLILIIILLSILQSQYVNTPINNGNTQNPVSSPQTTTPPPAPSTQSNNVKWQFNGTSWSADKTTPECSNQVFAAPTDLSIATSILYPGQTRGGNYKPHGGIRFDGRNNNEIKIVAPADSYAFRASRYIESGEVQYLIDFIVPCGYMYRFDHLLTLSPKFQEMANQLPEALVDDTKTTILLNTVTVSAGEEIATAVGFEKSKNVGFDFGVYYLKSKNEISNNSLWASEHTNVETAHFAICWLDILPAADSALVKSLPAGDSINGKTSDYCK